MFAWKEELELNIDSIDSQHKELFNIGNKVYLLLEQHQEGEDNYDEIINVINELKDYTRYHFKTEEDLFIKYHYPDYEKHKKEHESFIRYINSINLSTYDEKQELFLTELLKKIIDWIFNHIITTDYMYKDYLINLGLK